MQKKSYPCISGSLDGISPTTVINYTYGDAEWKDLLTAYNGQQITYDAIGNPLKYRNRLNFTWKNGRQLATATVGGKSLSFWYNESGVRTRKMVNGISTYYFLDGDTIVAQKNGHNVINIITPKGL